MTLLSDKARIVRMSNEASEYCTKIANLVAEMQRLDPDGECVAVSAADITDLKQKFSNQYLATKEQIAIAIDHKDEKCSHEKLIAIKYGEREIYECKECGKVLAVAPKNSEIVETIDKY